MKCPNCGFDIVNGAEFCGNCGNKLSQNFNLQQFNNQEIMQQNINNNQMNTNNNYSNNNVPKKNNTKTIIIIVVIIIACIGAIFVVKSMLSNSSSNNNENTGNTSASDNNSSTTNKSAFTIVDPLNHTITITDDKIYIKKVELDYLHREVYDLSQKADRITESEVENLNATETQKQAFKRAISYLSGSGFSYSQLVSQLEYEKFSHEDAVFVVDNSKVDWNEQAVISAKTTLAAGGKSEKELKEMLIYEKFSEEQANYAIKNVNADYYEQAVYQACFYKYSSSSSYTKEEATDRLKSRGYTAEEIEFAIKTVYEKMK